MNPWDDPDTWIAELRGFLGKEADDITDEDLMFITNVARQTVDGKMNLLEGLAEITRWRQSQMGMLGAIDDETFRMELAYNHPEMIEVTDSVKEFLRYSANEPGIADGLVEVWAHPQFAEFVAEHSGVAIKHKPWFAIERLNPNEHAVLGWAIAQAVASAN
jgi:hypothetical protein